MMKFVLLGLIVVVGIGGVSGDIEKDLEDWVLKRHLNYLPEYTPIANKSANYLGESLLEFSKANHVIV